MIYCDTSFVAPLVLHEASSDAVEACVLQLPAGEAAVSQWTQVEFAGLLARRVRLKELSARQAGAVWREFEQMLRESFDVVMPLARDFSLAATLVQKFNLNLRAEDALHLAIASNRKAARFLTLDAVLMRAAGKLKIPADPGISLKASA